MNTENAVAHDAIARIHEGEEWVLWTGSERWSMRFARLEETYQVRCARAGSFPEVRYSSYNLLACISWLLGEIGIWVS